MISSHNSPSKPSQILALICLIIVHRLRPRWVAVSLSDAAAAEGVNPERLSRLATRALPAFETTAAALSRRGRPPADCAAIEAVGELTVTRVLLEVATQILAQVSLRTPAVRALVVGAYLRLRADHGVSQKHFCGVLAISARTLRSWLDRAASVDTGSTVDRDTSADTASTADRDTSADTASTADRDTSADTASTADRDTSADTAAAADRDTSADTASAVDRDTSADTASAADRDTSADTASTADRDTSADTAATVERDTSTSIAAAADRDAPAPPQKKRRPPRRGRFGFDVLIPQHQIAADTTDLSAFGVPLKLIAAQDVGGRDANLLSSVLVDDHESAELVARVLGEALAELPGAQAITDQGTPYLAEHTRAALDKLEVEHAVQREADPLGKATIERAFGSVKTFARPLLGLTDRLARAVPALAQPALARALTTLLLTALLRAYQAGARAATRADNARAGVDVDDLVRAAEQSRERARADDRSARLLLEHIHTAYQISGSRQRFVRTFRRFALPALRTAERTFAAQAHRDDIKNRTAYFARLVRIADDDFRLDQARRNRELAQRHRFDLDRLANDTQHNRWRNDPSAHLADALEAVAAHWLDGRLLCDGIGPGTAWMRIAIDRLVSRHGANATRDIADGIFRSFARGTLDRLGPDGAAAVRRVLDRHLPSPTPNPTASCAARFAAILGVSGAQPRPPPSIRPC